MPKQLEMTMRMKDMFLDRRAVTDRISKANARSLKKVGAFIRRRARSSLRRRKKVSAAGGTPSVHSKDKTATLKNILFAYDSSNESLVVGPVKLNQVNQAAGSGANVPVPALHEFGGTVAILEKSTDKGKTWLRAKRRRNPRPWEQYRRRNATYAPRPFMGPALEAEQDNIPDAWSGSL